MIDRKKLLAAIGNGKTLPELAEEMGMMVVTKHPEQELCEEVMQAIADKQITIGALSGKITIVDKSYKK